MPGSERRPPPVTTGKNRSISRSLTVALISTVMVVSAITISLIYLTISHKTTVQLEEKANEYIRSLPGVLEISLWDLDERNVKRIGQAFSQNELVEELRVTNNLGETYFDFKRARHAPLIVRESPVLHQGQEVGQVYISLSTETTAEANRQLLLFGLGTLSAAILVLGLATGFILRTLLNKPLDRLGEIVNGYATGHYGQSELPMSVVEFRPLVGVLVEMGETITSQMLELRNAEQKYRSIFENAVEGIFQTTPEGRFLSVNPSMARILGYDSAEDLMEGITDIGEQLHVSPERRLEFIRLMRNRETVTRFHAQLYRKDGSPRVGIAQCPSRPGCSGRVAPGGRDVGRHR